MASLLPSTAGVPLNTQAITGNAASSAATIVPSYESISDPMLTFENLIHAPKQGKTFFTHFQSCTPVDYYPQTVTNPNVVFQWATQNFTYPNQYYIQIPIEFQYLVTKNGLPVTQQTDYPNMNNNPTTGYIEWDKGMMPNAPFYNLFKNIVLKIGDNNMQVGFFPMGQNEDNANALATTHLWANYFANEEIYDSVKMGLPWSQGAAPGAPGREVNGSISYQNMLANTCENPELRQYYGDLLQEIYNTMFFTNADANGSLVQAANSSTPKTVVIPYTIPLSLLRTWFQNDGIIPPNMNFRLEITMNPNGTVIGQWNKSALTNGLDTPNNYTLGLNARPVFDNTQVLWKIIEMNYIPRANIMQQFNSYWLNQPLVWHNNEMEYFDVPAFSTTNFNVECSINSQMPRQLILAVYYTGGGFGKDYPLPMNGGNYSLGAVYAYKKALRPGLIWSNIKITTSGNRDISFTTDYVPRNLVGSQNNLKDCLSTVTSKLQCYQERVGYENRISRGALTQTFNGSYVHITLDPTQHQRLGETTMDPGATVIRLSATITNLDGTPIGTDCLVRVYKTYDYQTIYGANKQASQIRWPASAQSGAKPPAISSTFNQVA